MVSVPPELFIFVSQMRPEAYLTFQHTRTFTSRFADCLSTARGRQLLDSGQIDPMSFVPNEQVHPTLSPFTLSAMNLYRVEWDAELGRRAHNPTAPSRMSAIYAFGDEPTCMRAASRYRWPLDSVRRFQVADGLPYRAVRVNMEVISLLRTVYPLASWSSEALNTFWRHYWTGQGNLEVQTPDLHHEQNWRKWTSGEMWEWLVEGQLVSHCDLPVFGRDD